MIEALLLEAETLADARNQEIIDKLLDLANSPSREIEEDDDAFWEHHGFRYKAFIENVREERVYPGFIKQVCDPKTILDMWTLQPK